MEPKIRDRNRRRAELTFTVLDAMEDLRDIWRATVPLQELDEQQKQEAAKTLEKAKKALDKLEQTL